MLSPRRNTEDAEQYRLAQVVEGNPVATIVIDDQHRITHWNRACELLTGMAAVEMVGSKDQWRAFYPQQRPILADLIVDGADGQMSLGETMTQDQVGRASCRERVLDHV